MTFGGKAPDPNALAQGQLGYNQQAAQMQQKLNMFNQTSPTGSLAWNTDPNSPSGYSANVNLSPAYQKLLDIIQGSQTTLGQAGQNLAGNVAGLYSQPPDLNTQTGQQLLGLQQQYWNPIFQQQSSNLESQLRNQGLTPGSTAYNNAKNLLARNQGDVTNQFLFGMQPQVFQQALQQYELPLQTASGLLGLSAPPTAPQFQQTPTAQIQPPAYASLAEQQYGQQQAQNTAMMQGLFGIPTALAGGWARAGFPGFG
jgi:hypothetical protein